MLILTSSYLTIYLDYTTIILMNFRETFLINVIVKIFAQLLNIQIEIQSESNKGTTVI